MKKEGKTKKNVLMMVISLLLVTVLMIVAMPQALQAFADEISKPREEKAVAEEEFNPGFEALDDVSDVSLDNAYIEFELNSKRTEYEKHYYLSNGLYMSEQHMEPVHFIDEDGVYQDIDNSLIEFEENGIKKLKNAKNSFNIEFVETILGEQPLMSISKGELKIDFLLDTEFTEAKQKDELLLEKDLDKTNLKTKKVTARIDSASKYQLKEEFIYRDKQLTQGIMNENLKSELRYNQIFNGVDFEYIIEQNRIKENIIINSKKLMNINLL